MPGAEARKAEKYAVQRGERERCLRIEGWQRKVREEKGRSRVLRAMSFHRFSGGMSSSYTHLAEEA